ncbi:hypothetical protein PQX77_011284 [Marasmius sp. AFHP31]|nr:hypothetical protein PQX77_011284 [Marasmius sp. AFHP31]
MAPQNIFETLRSPHSSFISSQETSKWIQEAQGSVQSYEKEIRKYENQVRQLRAKQAALRRDIARYSSLSSPIRKLPSETLRHIFGFASVHNQFGHGTYERRWYSGAFTLSSVCSRWREIAIGLPEIWSNISLRFEERALRPVKICLLRSGQCPLTLNLDGNGHNHEDDEDDDPQGFELMSEFCSILTQQCIRWREVDLVEASYSMIPYIEDHPLREAPLLESFTCCDINIGGLFAPTSHCTPPNIRDVGFTFVLDYQPSEDLAHVFPWQTIRQLRLEYDKQDTLAGILEVLQLGTNLQSLVYFGDSWVDSIPFRPYESLPRRIKEEDIVVSDISSLTIDMKGPRGFFDVVHDFFRAVTMPSLTSLTISCKLLQDGSTIHFHSSWPREVIHEFFERSASTITTLNLSGMKLSEPEVISTLQLTPSVHHFTLSEVGANSYDAANNGLFPQTITKSLLKRLYGNTSLDNAYGTQYPILSKLTFLRLEAQFRFDADEEFVDLVQSRWFKQESGMSRDVERLRTVELHVQGRKLSSEIYEPLKWVESDGMMVSIMNGGERVI